MSKSPTTTSTDTMGLAQMRRAPTHPGTMLAEMLRDADVSQVEAAGRLGMTKQALNAVRAGRRPMSPALCVKVAALMGTSVEFWGHLQMRHDLWHAMRDPKVVAQVRSIAPIAQVA